MSLSQEELGLIDVLGAKLANHEYKNYLLETYYEGKNKLKDLRISIPPQLTAVETVVGWAGTSVDVLEERLDFEGYLGGDDFGLNEIYRANELDLESSLAHRDALVYGTGFVVVGRGQNGEADPLITIESPKKMTAIYDIRTRRISAALLVNRDNKGTPLTGSLYLPNETIFMAFSAGSGWYEEARDVHNLGRVPVSAMPNNPRSGDPYGRSEITPAVRSYTDSAMRTLLGAEVAREFYSAPQRYILGADQDLFLDADGNPLNPWTVYQGRILGVPANEDGNVPTVGQFQANSTQPYFEQIRAYAQLLAAETAIPASYLGFQTDNPASADAIRQMESRLVKRAERRQRQFGRTWSEVGRLAIQVRDGITANQLPPELNNVRALWRDASTPTRAAAADEATKLISVGVLLPDSEVTYNRIGLTESDKQVLRQEKQSAQARQLVSDLAAATRQAIAPAAAVAAVEVENDTNEVSDRGGTVDEFQGLRTGDQVTLSDGRTGRVEHIMVSGVLGVPGSSFSLDASIADPALQVRIFENGAETETLVNVRFSSVAF